jgi:hypothetical protein
VYSFQGGHFDSTIHSWNLPFHIGLAYDPYKSGGLLFQEFKLCRQMFSSAANMLNHICASGNTSVIHGYLIQSQRFQSSEMTMTVWQLQATIIAQLCLIRLLSIVVAIVHPDHDGCSVKTYLSTLHSSGWIVASTDNFYWDLGDTLAGLCHIITAFHASCASMVDPLLLKQPPLVPPHPLGEFLCDPFNRPEHATSLSCKNTDFGKQEKPPEASSPKSPQDDTTGILIQYFLHFLDANDLVLVESEVISADGLCPAFNACPNLNIFQACFGIELHHEGCSYIRAIPSYKINHCFDLIN